MRYTGLVALLVGVVGACAEVSLRPVESERLRRVELSGGGCAYEIVPLDIGVCAVREVDLRPRRPDQSRLVRCGETATVCEQPMHCDCAQPRRLLDCEPGLKVAILSDGGVETVLPTRADGSPLPPLSPRRLLGTNKFGTCRFSMAAPFMGRCDVDGIIPDETDEWLKVGMYVPFAEDRELCGVRLSCRCGEFTERSAR